VWKLRVYVGRDVITGKERVKSRAFRGGRRAAGTALAQFVSDLDNPKRKRSGAPPKTTLTHLVQMYLDQHDGAPGTVASYRSTLRKHIEPTIGRLPIAQLDARILDEFYRYLREEKGLARSSVRSAHALISGALRDATRWGWLASNPARDARPPTVSQVDTSLPDETQVAALLAEAAQRDPELAVFLRLAAAIGARRGELCALRWSAVDLKVGTVRIDTSATSVGGLKIKDTKTHNKRRVALDSTTVAILAEHRRSMSERARLCSERLSSDAFVFSHASDCSRPWRPDNVSHAWERLRKRAGIDGIRLHDLRHFQATMLLKGGVPVKNVSKRIGHSKAATTLNVYAHFLEETDQVAADLIGTLLPPASPAASSQVPSEDL
jgi:integrase